jgi:hypothetical protein
MNRNEKMLQMKVVVLWKMMLVVIYFTSAILIFFHNTNDLLLHTKYVLKKKTRKKRNTTEEWLERYYRLKSSNSRNLLKKINIISACKCDCLTDISLSGRSIKMTGKMFKTCFAFICNSIRCYIIFFPVNQLFSVVEIVFIA